MQAADMDDQMGNRAAYAFHRDVIFTFCDMENELMTTKTSSQFSAMNRFETTCWRAPSPVFGTFIDAGKGMRHLIDFSFSFCFQFFFWFFQSAMNVNDVRHPMQNKAKTIIIKQQPTNQQWMDKYGATTSTFSINAINDEVEYAWKSNNRSWRKVVWMFIVTVHTWTAENHSLPLIAFATEGGEYETKR